MAAFLEMFDKGPGRKVMVFGPSRTFAFPKCSQKLVSAHAPHRSAAFIGDNALRRLGRPGATASWRSQHRFWSVQAGLPFSQRCVAPFHAILCHSPPAGSIFPS